MTLADLPTTARLTRKNTTPGVHPYDEITWERSDARIDDWKTGEASFEQTNVEFPSFWSASARNIVAQKYFRGHVGTPEREFSLKQVADRIVDTITAWGLKDGYFADNDEAEVFNHELKWLMINQRVAFNSPVWFNIGVNGVPQQASACFILDVEDEMDAILDWYKEEGVIFKGGSGAGVNLSKIRSSKELLQGGGVPSGPVSFMRGADASAGTIASGGKTRRAAKMVVLDVDHPDIEEFALCKAREEKKIRALKEAGFDMDVNGDDIHSASYQNANNSVRVTDEFMQAVEDDRDWNLIARTTGEVIKTVRARELFETIMQATWECADPGMQYDTVTNLWNVTPNTGRIDASNPCSEHVRLANSACNLASLNLLRFVEEGADFDVDAFIHAAKVTVTAQDILVGNSDYPTAKITDMAKRSRDIGLGYANLGATLMAMGLPYDSDEGRAFASAVTAVMTGAAAVRSTEIAEALGAADLYQDNAEPWQNVYRMHRAELDNVDFGSTQPTLVQAALDVWDEANARIVDHGARNAELTVLAPTGCLTTDSLVPTEKGLMRIGRLGNPMGEQWQDLGIDVASLDGKPTAATKFYVNGVENVVKIRTASGHQIAGTPTHRIKVVDPTTGEFVWKRLADVDAGDTVPLLLGGLVGESREIGLPPIEEPYHWGDWNTVVPAAVTAELAELVGYFMGDGSLHSRGLRFTVAGEDFDVADHLVRLVKDAFGVEASIEHAASDMVNVVVNSVRVARWWEACGFAKIKPTAEHVGKGWNPHIPDTILATNNPEVYGAFLRGLYEADGWVSDGVAALTSSEQSLIDDCQAMLLALGIPTTQRVVRKGRQNGAFGSKDSLGLRLANRAWTAVYDEKIGFVGGRKAGMLRLNESDQVARRDHIPVTEALRAELLARTATGSRTYMALCNAKKRGWLSREVAQVIVAETNSPMLLDLLNYRFDEVASADLVEEEMTVDLSVPENVTYVANGFVSHNTIAFAMDCDTTGIEPDLGLVKFKKLVGGGNMQIVNLTVPRALRRLGYTDEQINDITEHIAKNSSIIGAPHVAADHLPVFACAMGDNTIAPMGHVRMMAAAQPWISGAISKTVNVPEDTSVADLAEVHMEAWRLGVKAIAVYRDGCKTFQPMSTSDDDGKDSTASTVVEKIIEKVVTVNEPVREKMPRSRRSQAFEFRVAECKGFVHVGEYEDGRPGEVFIKVSKQGSTLAGIMDAFAIAISHGLQYGVPLKSYVDAFVNMRFEPAGMTDDPDLRIAQSIIDYIFKRLAVDYLTYEEREGMGILTVQERTQPTLPGVEESVVENRQGSDIAPEPVTALSSSNGHATGRAVVDGECCQACGSANLQWAGACKVCRDCASSSGCS